MNRSIYLIGAGLCAICLLIFGIRGSYAQEDNPPERSRHVVVTTTQYIWQVISNQTGRILCEVLLEEDREPTDEETLTVCGEAFYAPTATIDPNNPQKTPQPTSTPISGAEFFSTVRYELLEKRTVSRVVTIPMQPISVNLTVPDDPLAQPYITIAAYEPEPEYTIRAITGRVNGVEFLCASSPCYVPIRTDSQVVFWAVSSFGDESEHITAILRVLFQNQAYRVTLQSIAPVRTYRDSCADIWEVQDQGKPVWAAFPQSPEELHTQKKLYYLGEQLILSGLVDAGDCPNGGLMANGSPNSCGMDRAMPEMTRWQNQYDTAIWSTGLTLGLPPKLMKTLIEIESQFWPANTIYYLYEFGLAQINQYGADVALRWDQDLFQQICNGLLYDCSRNYASLPPWLQASMRGGLVRAINADCGECQYGIDFSQAVHSVPTIARVIRANCSQVDHIINQYNEPVKYEDLWRFSMVSYHSGYDCLNDAIYDTSVAGLPFTWENVSPHLESNCLGATSYVDDLWTRLRTFDSYRVIGPAPAPPSEAIYLPTPIPSPSPTPRLTKGELRVTVYVDENKNGRPDPGEGVSDVDVEVRVEGGIRMTASTVDGIALFDVSGNRPGARVQISLPILFRTEQAFLPETGELPVNFRLDSPDLPPGLP